MSEVEHTNNHKTLKDVIEMSKKNVFNDGVKNADKTENDADTNMPAGKKKPMNTYK